MISDIPTNSDKKIAKTPQLSEAIISNRSAGFVAANSQLM
jgi:hypothetical protein